MKRKRRAGSQPRLRIFRNSEYRVILYAKRDLFCATTGERLVEDKLAERDVIPLEGG